MFKFGQCPQERKNKLLASVDAAYSNLAGAVADDKIVYDKLTISLPNDNCRKRLASGLSELFSTLSHNPDNWITEDLPRLRARFGPDVEGNDPYELAAYTILVALLRTNLCCKGALAYPKDKQLNSAVLQLVTRNFEALDHLFLPKSERNSSFESTLASELLDGLIYVKQFFEN